MAEQEPHDHPEQQEEQNLPAEVLVGLYREEISRLLSENMDLRLELRWKAQIVEALQQQIARDLQTIREKFGNDLCILVFQVLH